MHFIINIGELLPQLWCKTLDCFSPDNKVTWEWGVLVDDVWTQHGAAVAKSARFLPTSFDRPPRDPALKLHSGYKAIELLHCLFGLAPGLLYGVLPDPYYKNFCQLVQAIQLLQGPRISYTNLRQGHLMALSFTQDFEVLYYQQRIEHIHFVWHSIHSLVHMAPET